MSETPTAAQALDATPSLKDRIHEYLFGHREAQGARKSEQLNLASKLQKAKESLRNLQTLSCVLRSKKGIIDSSKESNPFFEADDSLTELKKRLQAIEVRRELLSTVEPDSRRERIRWNRGKAFDYRALSDELIALQADIHQIEKLYFDLN